MPKLRKEQIDSLIDLMILDNKDLYEIKICKCHSVEELFSLLDKADTTDKVLMFNTTVRRSIAAMKYQTGAMRAKFQALEEQIKVKVRMMQEKKKLPWT